MANYWAHGKYYESHMVGNNVVEKIDNRDLKCRDYEYRYRIKITMGRQRHVDACQALFGDQKLGSRMRYSYETNTFLYRTDGWIRVWKDDGVILYFDSLDQVKQVLTYARLLDDIQVPAMAA